MEQGKIIQVFRFHGAESETQTITNIWELRDGDSHHANIRSIVNAYTDGKDDAYEVMTIIAGETTTSRRKLCWDVPPGCRKERLCVVLDNTLQDFRAYCLEFFG